MNPLAPWQQRVYVKAAEALDAGRLPHALLFAGPARLGKREVAERLARRALCLQPGADGEACADCRACRLFDTRHQLDPPELAPDGSLAHPWGHPAHPDARFIGYGWNDKVRPPRMRQEIVIEQIRLMSEKLALSAQYGERQVALIDPADRINHAACNALLKTLEEPQRGRFLWLVSARPARLPATIRSRTQVLEFRLPPRTEALDWLAAQGHATVQAGEALTLARGHPGLADQWLREGALTLRKEVAEDLQRLARDRAQAAAIAERWSADAQAALRLRFAADIAAGQARGSDDPQRMRALAHWFDQANRCHQLLSSTVRSDLLLLDLLLAWPAA
ncbi:DNA polymerase III subunit delta' [Luteimonas sp. e5]